LAVSAPSDTEALLCQPRPVPILVAEPVARGPYQHRCFNDGPL